MTHAAAHQSALVSKSIHALVLAWVLFLALVLVLGLVQAQSLVLGLSH